MKYKYEITNSIYVTPKFDNNEPYDYIELTPKYNLKVYIKNKLIDNLYFTKQLILEEFSNNEIINLLYPHIIEDSDIGNRLYLLLKDKSQAEVAKFDTWSFCSYFRRDYNLHPENYENKRNDALWYLDKLNYEE